MSIPRKTLKGRIVLIYFPFTNLTGRKLRPALVLYDSGRDVVVAFISSRIEKYKPETDILISKSHPEFHLTGLKTDSVLKLSKIATIHKRLIAGEIGTIGEQLRNVINQKIIKVLLV
ncbi:MAG: type II toxin-antitoxin system PemK/MazF family toxin [Desulfurococcales archaeon]|nr:type II toxin-antitoxin system PemK/MazF family toxin [Desulfurococcales archaeon]